MPNRRARLEIVSPAASTVEAAAVVAAVERFLRDTAPPAAPALPAPDPWRRAALREGVDRDPGGDGWGSWPVRDPHHGPREPPGSDPLVSI
jgi:hypothetical protein